MVFDSGQIQEAILIRIILLKVQALLTKRFNHKRIDLKT